VISLLQLLPLTVVLRPRTGKLAWRIELIEGGAARSSGKLMVGDQILAIAGRETKTLSMAQVSFVNPCHSSPLPPIEQEVHVRGNVKSLLLICWRL